MLESVQRQEQTLQLTLHGGSFHLILLVSFLFALVVVPAMLVAASVSLAKILSGRQVRWRESVSTFAQAFVPLGFSMWLAHFSYHLVNGALTAVPVIQRAAESAGLSILGKPDWSLSASMSSFDWLPSVQLFRAGAGASVHTLRRLARSRVGFRLEFARTLGMVAPVGGAGARALLGRSLDRFSADADARHDDGWNH